MKSFRVREGQDRDDTRRQRRIKGSRRPPQNYDLGALCSCAKQEVIQLPMTDLGVMIAIGNIILRWPDSRESIRRFARIASFSGIVSGFPT